MKIKRKFIVVNIKNSFGVNMLHQIKQSDLISQGKVTTKLAKYFQSTKTVIY